MDYIQRCQESVVSILQKSRTWLHRQKTSRQHRRQNVSILQKSRTWLHIRSNNCGKIGKLCQSFRNQGPGYTVEKKECPVWAYGVNPSEIKDLVTPPLLRLPTPPPPVSILQKSRTWLHRGPGDRGDQPPTGVNPSEIKDLVTLGVSMPLS